MSELSKQALKVDNNTSFPNNNTNYITPSILRAFNVNVIDSVVVEDTYQPFTQSVLTSLDALDNFTASLNVSFNSLNAFTASASISIGALNANTQSVNYSISVLNAFTSSQLSINSGLNASSASQQISINSLNTNSASVNVSITNVNSATASLFTSVNNINTTTASLNTSASLALTTASFSGNTLTFTKGNGTQFGIVLPDVSGSILPNGIVSSSAQITTLGFVSSSVTASSLVTASFDNGTRNLTFTKGDATTFNVNIPDVSGSTIPSGLLSSSVTNFTDYSASVDSRIDSLEGVSGSYATTGSNTFTGVQTFTQAVTASVITFPTGSFGNGINIFQDGLSQIRFYSGSTTTQVGTWVNMQVNPANGALAISSFPSNNHFVDFDVATTASLFTAPLKGMGNAALQILGDTSFRDTTGNLVTVQSYSGSFVLTAKGIASGSSTLAHLSSSAADQLNLVFKNNAVTADTIVSGSNNIFPNPAGATTGFKRYIGTSNYYTHGSGIPQISGSMAWSPTMVGNISSNNTTAGLTFRGPVSSSASNINHNIVMGGQIILGSSAANHYERAVAGTIMSGNALFNGSITMVANTTFLSSSAVASGNLVFGGQVTLNHISSSISYNSNVTNGSTTINNRFLPAAGTNAAALSVRANTNTLYGIGHAVNVDGTNTSTTIGKAFTFNILAGTFLTSSIGTGDNCNILSTGMIGNGLIVTGSTLTSTFAGADSANSGQGSLFVGRFNSLTGTSDMTAETIFAVGTGTSYTNRKTGFLIDSGSNTFVEGTLNVSGSTTMTGSLRIAPTFEARFATGSNQQAGTATLDGGNPGTVTVSNSLVSANSIILITKQTLTNSHMVAVSSKGAGTFTITSNGNGDADTVGWFIINNS